MAVKPPKCKTCGREEWRHVCGGEKVTIHKLPGSISSPALTKALTDSMRGPSEPQPKAKKKPKTDRKEYLKLKARERRARQKEEKAKNAPTI